MKVKRFLVSKVEHIENLLEIRILTNPTCISSTYQIGSGKFDSTIAYAIKYVDIMTEPYANSEATTYGFNFYTYDKSIIFIGTQPLYELFYNAIIELIDKKRCEFLLIMRELMSDSPKAMFSKEQVDNVNQKILIFKHSVSLCRHS